MSFILQTAEPFSKDEVTRLIGENSSILDEHLELIGKSIGTKTEKWCDLVGIGKDNQLVIIEVEERYTDRMLSSILCKLDAVWDNMDTIAQIFSAHEIERNSFPRVIILAPLYPNSFIRSLGYFTYRIRMDLFTYKSLESEKGRGLLVEPVERKGNYGNLLKADKKTPKLTSMESGTQVTTEEIMEFLH
jgi:hypothetical protein